MGEINKEKLDSIKSKIEEKRDMYISLIKSTYANNKGTIEEKEDFANDVFTSELEAYIERIKTHVNEQAASNKGVPSLTERMGVNIFLEVMQQGLSFAPASNHIYLSRLKGTGTSIGYKVTVLGTIFLVKKAGTIESLSEVVIVRNDEPFKIVNKDGQLTVEHEMTFDNKSFDYDKDFKLSYVYINYPSGHREVKWTDKATMDKARSLSPTKSLYNDISFLKTKTILRALKPENKVNYLLNSQSVGGEMDEVEEFEFASSNSQTFTDDKSQSFTDDNAQSLAMGFDLETGEVLVTTTEIIDTNEAELESESIEVEATEEVNVAPVSNDDPFGDLDLNF